MRYCVRLPRQPFMLFVCFQYFKERLSFHFDAAKVRTIFGLTKQKSKKKYKKFHFFCK